MSKKSASRWHRFTQATSRALWWIGVSLWVSRIGIRSVPREIGDDELLIRAVTTYGKKAKGLKGSLFRNPDDQVSVSRNRWVEPWLAKFIAKARIQNLSLKPPNRYEGLAFITAAAVRAHGSNVTDSRMEYLGHSDISHGTKQPVGEVLPAAVKKMLDERAQALANAATFIQDPEPRSLRWKGKVAAG
jgi:hypothetical protein